MISEDILSMTPSSLVSYLKFCIPNKLAVLIPGGPGIGKSDIVAQVAEEVGADLMICHPVVDDPTDYKGLPFATDDKIAEFLPYPDLKRLMDAPKMLICFFDDLGQSEDSVQAAIMQLVLARRINGHRISDNVVFVAATNRVQDRSGARGILASLRTRFKGGIIELVVSALDWEKWAIKANMPPSLISFLRYKPDYFKEQTPPKDLKNFPTPRTMASVGDIQNKGLPKEFELVSFAGIIGEAFAREYVAFLKLFRTLPSIDQIIMNPTGAKVHKAPDINFAVSGFLAHRMNDQNIGPILQYLERIPAEYGVACIQQAVTRDETICHTPEFLNWSSNKQGVLL